MEEHQKLMKDQAEIEKKTSLNVKGYTLFETIFEVCKHQFNFLLKMILLNCCIFKCLKHHQFKFGEQLRKDFKMSDNQ